MTQTFTAADAALKEDYEPLMREQVANAGVAYSQLTKNTRDVEGRRAILSLHVSRNVGVGGRAELATLPTAGKQGYREERVPVFTNYGRMALSGKVIRAMRSDKGSFVRAVTSEMKGLRTDMREMVSRQSWNRSTKDLAQCGVTTASTTVTLDSSTGQSEMLGFEQDMLVDIGTVASPTAVVAAAKIVSVDIANRTITIDSSVTTATTNYVFVAGENGEEITGLRQIIDNTGTLHNVDPATTERWKSQVDDNGGTPRSFTDTLLERMVHNIEIFGGATPDVAFCSYAGQEAYAAQFKTQKQFLTTDLKGGYKGLTVNVGSTELALTADKWCPDTQCFVASTENLYEYKGSDWEFMSEDGAILHRLANQDGYEATLYLDHEVATDKRNAHGVIKDLSV